MCLQGIQESIMCNILKITTAHDITSTIKKIVFVYHAVYQNVQYIMSILPLPLFYYIYISCLDMNAWCFTLALYGKKCN